MGLTERTWPVPAVATVLAGVGLIAVAPASPVDNTLFSNMQLAGEELIMMGGTGHPTVEDDLVDLVAGAINDRYGTNFVRDQNIDNLYTPESTYNGTYQDGEIDLLNALNSYKGDDVTVYGVSQSAGIVGMAIHDIQTGQFPTGAGAVSPSAPTYDPNIVPLPSDFSASDLPQNIHWVALAPPSMPLHGHAGGEFSADTTGLVQPLWPNVTLFPTNAGNADVYCGMYDQICDYPTNTDTAGSYAQSNSLGGFSWIHGGYAKLTSAEINYEMSHATEFTIGPAGVTIYPDQQGAPTDMTHFYLMPNVFNWGTDDDPYYDSLLPALASDLTFKNQAHYEQWLPYDTLWVSAGYNDELHPFEYMIGGVEYTFYNNEVVPVSELPAGASAPVVGLADLSGEMNTLATQIAWGLASPTGDEVAAASTAVATDAAWDSNWLSDLLAWI